jgi:hypothetical protein
MATSRKLALKLDQSTFLLEEHHANPSRSQGSVSDWMTRAATSPSNISLWLAACAPAGSFGKMSPASFPLTPEANRQHVTFRKVQLEEKETVSKTVTSPCSSPSFGNAGMGSPTEFLTLSISEWTASLVPSHSDGSVCSLSDILETGDLPPQYYLSPKACAGILRRAGKRGKEMPEQLTQALRAVAEQASTLE